MYDTEKKVKLDIELINALRRNQIINPITKVYGQRVSEESVLDLWTIL